MELESDTKLVLLAAGLFFLWALCLGVVKWRQMATSETNLAHPYTDTAHRAALLYSFATLLVAVFVELSGWSKTVDLIAAGGLILFFAAATLSYMIHGLKQDTENQFVNPVRGTHEYMVALVLAEILGFAVLLAGFVDAQF